MSEPTEAVYAKARAAAVGWLDSLPASALAEIPPAACAQFVDRLACLLHSMESAPSEATARERALDAALGFAVAAIADAIYTEDGLDGAAGERVLCLLAEAKKYGTHDTRAVNRAEMLDLFGLACPDDDPGT